VTSSESCENAIKEVLDHPTSKGKIDILVNNAGAGGAAVLLDTKVEDVIRVYEVNVSIFMLFVF
jgi:NAD(P)-dependent dehydrogenase (short-subunit alcohol dehydrogenase family)